MLTRIDHIDIQVRDLAAHVDFFQRLGFQILRSTEHRGRSVELKLPGENQVVLELREAPAGESEQIRHLAFAVDDLDRSHEELRERGLRFEKTGHFQPSTGRYLSNVIDPSGGLFQLIGPESVRDR